jgi:hypothetical protein
MTTDFSDHGEIGRENIKKCHNYFLKALHHELVFRRRDTVFMKKLAQVF